MLQERLGEMTHFQRLVIRDQVSPEELLTGSYIRFSTTDAWRPNINIYETSKSYLLCVDVAGMKPEEIHVDVSGSEVAIRGERSAPMPEDRAAEIGVHVMEIDTGVFCRNVQLPSPVRRDAVTANYRDGLLWVVLPKAF